MSAGGTSGPPEKRPLFAVRGRTERFVGAVFTVRSDEVEMPDGSTAVRDYTHHPGAVAVVALDEDDAGGDQVVLVQQYRHAIAAWVWELPAGILDVAGETPLAAAQRELGEETDLAAARWNVLLDLHPSPGHSDEHVRIFLARGLTELPPHGRQHEEAAIVVQRIGLTEAVTMALRGEITNAAAAAGVLAAARVRDEGWISLRPAG